MLELINAETGERVTSGIAHGPVYDPLDEFMGYVVSADCSKFAKKTTILLVDSKIGHAIAHLTLHPMDAENQHRIKRVILPTFIVGDPRNPDNVPKPMLGFILAYDRNDAENVMARKGFTRTLNNQNVWLDHDRRAILFPTNYTEMRGKSPAVVYATENFTRRDDAEIFAHTAKLALKSYGGEITVI